MIEIATPAACGLDAVNDIEAVELPPRLARPAERYRVNLGGAGCSCGSGAADGDVEVTIVPESNDPESVRVRASTLLSAVEFDCVAPGRGGPHVESLRVCA